MSKYKRIVVSGSIGFDVIMKLPGRFADFIMPDKLSSLNVSFTVDSLRREYGGTGGNCAYGLGLLGVKPKLIGTLGKDGGPYLRRLQTHGVDVSAVGRDQKKYCAVGHVMTDKDNNQLWSYYPGALVQGLETSLAKVTGKNDFLAMLPSTPDIFREQLKELAEIRLDFMFDPAFFIPNLTPDELRQGLNLATIIIGNDYEITMMQRKSKTSIEDWVKQGKVVVTTLGAKGSEIRHDDKVWRIPVAKPKTVADPTGAGDAYRAGFLAGWYQGLPLPVCGRMGSVMAAYKVEKFGTQNFTLNPKQFRLRYRQNFKTDPT